MIPADDSAKAIRHALMGQVAAAVPDGYGSELDVVTIITRPLWRAWNRAVGSPEDCEPTEWLGSETHRVYGSRTIVVESDEMRAVSFPAHMLTL